MFVDFDAEGEPLPLGDTTGQPFVLKIDGLAAKIGPRLPGAFRGY